MRPAGARRGKLRALIAELEEAGYQWLHKNTPLSGLLFGELAAAWLDWTERHIPPTRKWRGRGGQNPWVLQAFGALDRARARAQAEAERKAGGSRESGPAFAARIQREVMGG